MIKIPDSLYTPDSKTYREHKKRFSEIKRKMSWELKLKSLKLCFF